MTREEFIKLAIGKGLPKEKIKQAMDRRRSEIGAFDDDESDTAAPAAGTKPEFMQPKPIPGVPGIGGEKAAPPGPPAKPGPEAGLQEPIRDPDGNITGYIPVKEMDTGATIGAAVGGIAGFAAGGPAGAAVGAAFGSGYPTRAAGAAIPSKATRGTKPDGSLPTFKEALGDPETGLGRAARDHLGDIIAERLGNLSKKERTLLQKHVDETVLKMAVTGYAAVTILEDPGTLLTGLVAGGLKGLERLVPRLKSLVQATSKIPGGALERGAADLPAVKAAAGTEAKLSEDIADEVGGIRTANANALEAERAADLSKYEGEVGQVQDAYQEGLRGRAAEIDRRAAAHADATARQEAGHAAAVQGAKDDLTQGVTAARPGGPLPTPSAVDPYASGKRLETAAASAREAIGAKFGKKLSEAFHQSGVSSQPLPQRVIKEVKGTRPTGLVDAAGVPIHEQVVKVTRQNPMEDFIDESLRNVGYDPKKGYQGNEEVSQAAIKWALERKGFAKNQRTLGQLLKYRRNFQDQLFKASDGPTPLFPRKGQGANDYRFLKSVYDESNDLIASLPAKYLGDEKGAAFRDAFRELNADYSSALENLNDVSQGLGRGADPEEFIAKIKTMGADNWKAFNQAAQKHPEVKAVVEEMRTMLFDNMVRASLDPKDGNAFSPDRFAALWNAEYRDNRALLQEALGGERVLRINSAVAKYKLPEKPAPIPKPEAPLDVAKPVLPEKPEALPKQTPAYYRLAGRSEVPDVDRIAANVRGLGGQDPRKVNALRELEFLDNVLGLKGKDRYTEKALDAWAAKELGIDDKGVVPSRNLKHTGFASGSRVAGSATGAGAGFLVGKLLGGQEAAGVAIGTFLGSELGARVTSPSAALAAYKLLGKLDGVAKSKKAIQLLKAATKTRSPAALQSFERQLEAELGGKLIPFRQVADADSTGSEGYTGEPADVVPRR
ncbi:MAG TPA: hypothetical protein VK465_14485 [Fibrobacteria bacterium]|nr:hypothetical protein [Fibrobacteria bacterium]